jgi:ABC-type phosphate transport system permease subunit
MLATGRLAAAAAGAALLGYVAGRLLAGLPSIVVGGLGGLIVLAAFVGLAQIAGAREVTELTAKVTQRIRHDR